MLVLLCPCEGDFHSSAPQAPEHSGLPHGHSRGAERRGDLRRPHRPDQSSVPLGSRGPPRRPQLLLDPHDAPLGRRRVGRAVHPAHRDGGHRGLRGRRPGQAAGHRLGEQRHAPAPVPPARGQDPQRLAHPEQPGSGWFQRALVGGHARQGADLPPRRAGLRRGRAAQPHGQGAGGRALRDRRQPQRPRSEGHRHQGRPQRHDPHQGQRVAAARGEPPSCGHRQRRSHGGRREDRAGEGARPPRRAGSRRPCLRRRSHHARQGLHDHDCRQGRQEALVADARRGQRHAVQPRLHRGELGEGARPARGGQLHPHQERPHRDQVAVGHGHRRGRWNLRLAGRFEDGVLEQRADQGEGQAPREDPGRVAAYGSAGRPRGRAESSSARPTSSRAPTRPSRRRPRR